MSEELDIAPDTREVDAAALETAQPVETTEPVEAAQEQPVEESTASDDDATQPDERSHKPSRRDKRIDALTREKYERDKTIKQLQEQMAYLQQQIQPQQPIQDDMPRLADFGYDEDQYHTALREWNQTKITDFQKQQREAAEQQARQQYEIKQRARLAEQVEKASEKYSDFQEKVFDPSVPSLQEMNPYAFDAMMASDTGMDVAYYLANNPQELYRFAEIANNPMQTVRELTMLDMRLQAAPPQQVRTPPKPPSTVSQGASEAITDPNQMDIDTWMKWRNSQLQSKR